MYQWGSNDGTFAVNDRGRGDVTIMVRLPAKPMSTGGFKVETEGGRVDNLDISIIETSISVKRSFLYSTCPTSTIVQTGDTCTQGCSDCLNNLYEHEKNQNIKVDHSLSCEHKKAGTSKWHCEGFGCLSVDSGCTCAYCYHIKKGDCSDVFKVAVETVKARVCFRYQSKAKCLWVHSYQALANKQVGMLLDEAPETNIRGSIYVQSGEEIRVGAIK